MYVERGEARREPSKAMAAAGWLPRLNLLEQHPGVFLNPSEGWAGSPRGKLESKGACPQTRQGKKGVLLLPASSTWRRGTAALGLGV